MMKRARVVPAGIAALAAASLIAFAAGVLNLPAGLVSATHGPWDQGTLGGTIDITLSGVPAGHDVMDGPYAGWCIEDNHQPDFPAGTLFTLLDSTDDPLNLPATYQSVPWDKVNYLLNHKAGTIHEVQAALWIVAGTDDLISPTFPLTAAAQAMVNDANLNGTGFVPGPGQVAAVILDGDGLGPGGFQDTIIEVPVVPPPAGEGCTPGYWRNHLEDWPPTGYAPGDDFDATFGVNYFNPNITLGTAINLGGGGVRRLARHGTAALLSSSHPDVNYPYTPAEVIALVQAGETDPLAAANELGCDIP